jgi:hypothetical protein
VVLARSLMGSAVDVYAGRGSRAHQQRSRTRLRSAVLGCKGSYGSGSGAGGRFAERLLAILVAACEAAVHGVPIPSLLPAPRELNASPGFSSGQNSMGIGEGRDVGVGFWRVAS